MFRKLLLASTLSLGLCACPPAPEPPVPPPPPVVDIAAVTAQVDTYVTEMEARITAGDVPGFTAFLSSSVFWIGSAANEALVGREAVTADLQAVFGPALAAGATMAAQSANRKIGVAPDGRSAWVAEELTVTVTAGTDVTPIPYRLTSVLAEDAGAWTVIAQAWSIGMPNEEAFAAAAQGALPALAPVAESIGAGAQPLVDLLQAGCADPAAWLASWSRRPDAFSFGSAPEEKLDGGAAIHEVFGQQITGYQMRIAVNGGLHAAVAPSGTVGFLAGNLDVSFTMEGNTLTQPYRALFVYLQEADGWKLVQSHFSNGLPQ
jgi:hypothetical protein